MEWRHTIEGGELVLTGSAVLAPFAVIMVLLGLSLLNYIAGRNKKVTIDAADAGDGNADKNNDRNLIASLHAILEILPLICIGGGALWVTSASITATNKGELGIVFRLFVGVVVISYLVCFAVSRKIETLHQDTEEKRKKIEAARHAFQTKTAILDSLKTLPANRRPDIGEISRLLETL